MKKLRTVQVGNRRGISLISIIVGLMVGGAVIYLVTSGLFSIESLASKARFARDTEIARDLLRLGVNCSATTTALAPCTEGALVNVLNSVSDPIIGVPESTVDGVRMRAYVRGCAGPLVTLDIQYYAEQNGTDNADWRTLFKVPYQCKAP